MRYDEVYKIGETVGRNEFHFFSHFAWWEYILYIGVFLLISYICIQYGEYDSSWIILTLTFIVMIMVLPVGNWMYNETKNDRLNESEIENYINTYVTPLIESIPTSESEVIYLKVDNEMEVEGYLYFGTGTIDSSLLSTFSIMYKDDNEVKPLVMKAFPVMTLEENSTPTITYKHLKADLPYVEKGMYNMKLHLPVNYKFTDIK